MEYSEIIKTVGYIPSVNITGCMDETVRYHTASFVSVSGYQTSVLAAYLGCLFLVSRHTGFGGPIRKMRAHNFF